MSDTEYQVVAIDGPSASGKSTVARAVAEALQYHYVDTGAMYRSIAWKCIESGVDSGDEASVSALLEQVDFRVLLEDGRSKLLIDGVDPSPHIRSEEVSANVSRISAIPTVRARLVKEQRCLAEHHDLVMEGRDIGTVVFPETPYKFFIDANAEVRAKRRADELQANPGQIARSLERRDELDSTRTVSPLKPAADAVRIDTSDKTVEAVVDLIIKSIRSRRFSK